MARVSQIKSMQPGSGAAGGGGGPSVSTPAIPSAPSGSTPAASQEDKKPTYSPTVNVYIAGNVIDQDKFARELIPSITKAIADNAQ